MTDNELLINLLSSKIGIKEVNWIKENATINPKIFDFLFKQISNENKTIAWHSLWVLEKLSKTNFSYFTEKHIKAIIEISISTPHFGIQRLIYTILLRVNLPHNTPTSFINKCFDQISSSKSPISIQCTAAKIIEKIGNKNPDFLQELAYTLQNTDSNYCSKGFQNTKKNILKRLNINMNTFK